VEVFKSRQRWREMVKGERTMERSRGEVGAGGPTPSTRSAQPDHKYSMNHCELISFLKNTIFLPVNEGRRVEVERVPSTSPKLKTD